jgi:hypothetical protein
MERTTDESQASEDPPDVVFHYTTLSGLIGILGVEGNEMQLWALKYTFYE